jgi:phage terminase Nu1 subunit (DNA packaging protein)
MTLTDLDKLTNRAQTTSNGDLRGGSRPGAGRKKGSTAAQLKEKAEAAAKGAPDVEVRSVEQVLEEGLPPPMDMSADAGALAFKILDNPSAYYSTAKARKEVAQASKAELEFRIMDGQYLPRESIRSALAEAYQAVAQSLRSIPDNLERKLGVTPDIAEVVSTAIDEAMGELAYSMEQMHVKANERINTN